MIGEKAVINEEIILTIIAMSGEANCFLQQAFNAVREYDYKKVEEFLKKADESLNKAHNSQTSLIVKETQGEKNEIGVFMVHAQDHLMNTVLTKQLIKNMISMQKEINELKDIRRGLGC